jgi:hypothetical protein
VHQQAKKLGKEPRANSTQACSTAAHHLHIRLLNTLFPSGFASLANGVAQSREAVTRMEYREHSNSDDNHDALKDNELVLVAHDLASPATCQLGNTVNASHKDTNIRHNDSAHETTKVCVMKKHHRLLGQLIAAAICAQSVLGKEVAKEDQDNNLEDDTRNHHVCASVLEAGPRVCRGCKTTTCALEYEREDIASDEDACVPDGLKATPSLAKADDNVLESEVDTGGYESGRNDEAADLHGEAAVIERVVVEHDTATVADCFANATKAERNLLMVSPAEVGVYVVFALPYRSMSCI